MVSSIIWSIVCWVILEYIPFPGCEIFLCVFWCFWTIVCWLGLGVWFLLWMQEVWGSNSWANPLCVLNWSVMVRCMNASDSGDKALSSISLYLHNVALSLLGAVFNPSYVFIWRDILPPTTSCLSVDCYRPTRQRNRQYTKRNTIAAVKISMTVD